MTDKELISALTEDGPGHPFQIMAEAADRIEQLLREAESYKRSSYNARNADILLEANMEQWKKRANAAESEVRRAKDCIDKVYLQLFDRNTQRGIARTINLMNAYRLAQTAGQTDGGR